MEVYAGFVTHTDHHLGRLFDAIEARGIADDPIVMVLSDNGASAEGGVSGTLNEAAGWLGFQEDVEASMERIDEIGGHDAYNHYTFGWAWAGNTPLRLWKRYAWLGGVRTPLVVSWGAKVADPGAIRGQFVHAVDLFSTVLDAAGIDVPTAVDGVTQQPVDGVSLLPSIVSADAPEHRGLQYFEMMGSRGIYADGWKAVTDYVPNQFGERETLSGSFDFASDHWSLFRPTDDFSEAVDVSAEHPDVIRRLEELWWAEAGRNQVLPLFEFPASMAHMHPGAYPQPASATYTPGGGPIQESQLPSTLGGFDLTADIVVPEANPHRAEDILAAIGDAHGGWGCYLLEGRLVAAFAMLDGLVRVAAEEPVTPGPHQVSVQYVGGLEPHARLLVDGVEGARVPLPGLFFFPNLSTAATGMFIGRDRGLALCRDYAPPYDFTGDLTRVTITSGSPGDRCGLRVRASHDRAAS